MAAGRALNARGSAQAKMESELRTPNEPQLDK